VSGVTVLIPPGGTGQPINIDVSTAGEPGGVSVASAVATWPGAVSLSWAQDRPHDWTRVLEAVERLGAPPFDGEMTTWTQEVTVEGLAPPWTGIRFLRASVLPHLGVTVVELHGLNQTTVTIVAGRLEELPSTVRMLPAGDDGAHAFTGATERAVDEAERRDRDKDQELGGEG
jgi:hypothetical protein